VNQDYPNTLISKYQLRTLNEHLDFLKKENENLKEEMNKIQEEFKKERTEHIQVIRELCEIIKGSY
jgi:prefoldin subunit 5